MSDQNEGYDFSELRPVMWMFSSAGVAMFLVGALFGLAAFLWFLLAGSLVLLVASFFLEPLIGFLGGTRVPIDTEGMITPHDPTKGTDAA